MEERNGLSTWNFVGIPHTLLVTHLIQFDTSGCIMEFSFTWKVTWDICQNLHPQTSNFKLQDFWFAFNPCPQTYSTLYRHSSNDCLDSGKFCLNFWRTVPVFQAKWPVSALEVHEIDLRLQHFFFVLLFLPHVHHRSERHQDIIDFWATALDAQVRDHVYGGSFAERSWFLKSTSCMSKDVVLGKNTCGHVPTNLDPIGYATKITSSLAFKQLVEWVGIFCNCCEHLLAFVLRFEKQLMWCKSAHQLASGWAGPCPASSRSWRDTSLQLRGWKLAEMISIPPLPYESSYGSLVWPSNHRCETAKVKGTTILTHSREKCELGKNAAFCHDCRAQKQETLKYTIYLCIKHLCVYDLMYAYVLVLHDCLLVLGSVQPLRSACPAFLRSFGWTSFGWKGT